MSNDILAQYRWLEEELAGLIGKVKFSAEINLRLERIMQLLQLLGNPHLNYHSVHIGGTSGKGSTATMVAQILTAAGYKVGLHTSPHLQILNERHQINGRLVPTSQLVQYWREIKPAIEQVKAVSPFGAPSYFEAQVALGFYLFAKQKVDVAVVEVGLGGSLDATNVLLADVAVLTNVGLDHTDILGDTVELIAQDKSGIIKPQQRVVSGCTQESVKAIVHAKAAEMGATVWQLGRDFSLETAASHVYHLNMPQTRYENIELKMLGDFQAQNAAVAVAAVLSLQEVTALKVTERAIRAGLARSKMAGRIEVMQERPLVLLDGAHNEDKMRAVATVVAEEAPHHGRVIAVLSLKAGKAAADIVPFVVNLADEIILTRFVEKGLWQAVPPHDLVKLIATIDPSIPTQVITDPLIAVQVAVEKAQPEDIVWVTGSLYLVGDVRAYWRPIPELLQEIEEIYLMPQAT